MIRQYIYTSEILTTPEYNRDLFDESSAVFVHGYVAPFYVASTLVACGPAI